MRHVILILLAASTLPAHSLHVEKLPYSAAQKLAHLEQQAAKAQARYDAALERVKARYSSPHKHITIEDGYVLIRTYTDKEIEEINRAAERTVEEGGVNDIIWRLLTTPYPGTPSHLKD